MKNETYLALTGGRLSYYWWGYGKWPSEGQPAEVSFDHKLVMENESKIVGFYHTHPSFTATPSGTDIRTMGAWTVCFGRPLICLIDGIDGLKAYWFEDDEKPFREAWVKRLDNLFIGSIPEGV